MQGPKLSGMIAVAASLMCAAGASGQELHDVTTMLSIAVDSSDSTWNHPEADACASDFIFTVAMDTVAGLLADADAFPRDGRLVLSVVHFGSGCTGRPPTSDCLLGEVVVPPVRLTHNNWLNIQTMIQAAQPGAGDTPVGYGMMCAGETIEQAKLMYTIPRTAMLVVVEGVNNCPNLPPSVARATLLGSGTTDSISAIGVRQQINGPGSPEDPTDPGSADTEVYVESNVCGPDPMKLPLLDGESPTDYGSYYDVAYSICPDADVPSEFETDPSFAEALRRLVVYEVYRCGVDLNADGKIDLQDLGILNASFGLQPGDPYYNPIADINDDGEIDISDLGALLAEFGCGTAAAP
jgi:hypothetical protein